MKLPTAQSEVRLDRVAELFEENFASFGELGASVSVWQEGEEILSLAAGFRDREKTQPWTAATPVLFWSATKGLTAACVLHACATRGVSLDEKVVAWWPEFGAEGKGDVTIGEVMSHQAGLPALSRAVSVLDYATVVEALAEEPAHWIRGSGHGYHPRTFGFLLDELLRRITGGITLRDYWRATFAEPLKLDLWIGVDPERADEVAPIFPARTAPPKGDTFYTSFLTAGSFTARAFGSPRGLHSVVAMNASEIRTAAFPAFGGIGTASSLAKFYAVLASDGVFEGRRFFEPKTIAEMTDTLVQGHDRVLQIETAFSAGFMRDPVDADGRKKRANFGPSPRAFGHPGAGGSIAFADPDRRVSFAYVMNQMEPGVLPNQKSLRLIEALYG